MRICPYWRGLAVESATSSIRDAPTLRDWVSVGLMHRGRLLELPTPIDQACANEVLIIACAPSIGHRGQGSEKTPKSD
ncbi:MAG: hypothetical protein F6K56_09255 [Moorea sp. SIO3G5]|nr:hypothetical protein [Moorena sp. SIO3G5]